MDFLHKATLKCLYFTVWIFFLVLSVTKKILSDREKYVILKVWRYTRNLTLFKSFESRICTSLKKMIQL